MEELSINKAFENYIAYISNRLKPTTVLGRKQKIKKHVLPIFNNKNIYEIDDDDFIKWQNYIKDLGYSNGFNDQIFSMTKGFFDYLVKFYNIENFAMKFGKVHNFNFEEKKELNVWSLKEFKKFIKVVDNTIYHALFSFLFFTGVRKGEALALKFNDLKGKYVTINKTLTKELFNGKRIELSTKTKQSTRKIRIDWKLRSELNFLRKYYTKIYGYFDENFYIFGGNRPISTTALERKKNNYCHLAGVKKIRIHDFRHSHATILYHKKIKIKYIQLRLGHSDIATTLNTYIHIDNNYEKKVYNTLNFLRLFF